LIQISALTFKASGLANVIISDVQVATPTADTVNPRVVLPFKALWDTGASGSVITEAVVAALGIAPTGVTQIRTANGSRDTNVYAVDILLPSGVSCPNWQVAKADVSGADVLIGMDVIHCGDFSITNVDGKTTVSFRVPSLKEIDYVEEARRTGGVRQNRAQRRHPSGRQTNPPAGTRGPRGGGTSPPRRASA
jgi:predicted aspartyl protease